MYKWLHRFKKVLIWAVILVIGFSVFAALNIKSARADNGKYKPDPTKAWEIPPNTDESTWSSNQIDSGSSMFIACPLPATINNAPLSGDQFPMSIPYQITFTPEDHEYIDQTVLAVWDKTDGTWANIDLNQREYTSLNESFNYTFALEHEYNFSVVIVVNSGTWYSIDETNAWRESNVCGLMRSSDPTKTIGENVSTGSTDYNVHTDSSCGFDCGLSPSCWVATRIAEVICAFIQGLAGMTQWIIDTLFTGTFNA